MPHTHSADPRHTYFCQALFALAPTPRLALHAFALRLLAHHMSKA